MIVESSIVGLGEEYLKSLAAAISDGQGVNWSEAEARVDTDEEQGLIERLRDLAKLAGVHRAAHQTADAEAETRELVPSGRVEEPETLQGGRFVLLKQLGTGGFGVVYQAYDRQRKMDVAIKSLHHTDVGSVYDLKKEFRALAGLSHANLVTLYDLFGDADRWFIVMELVRGQDFLSYIRGSAAPEAKPATTDPQLAGWQVERLAPTVWQLAHALGYLHSQGKLHRDIKPSNVLVTTDGRVKLLDFGLAIDAVGDAADTVRLRGTPAYVSPEQAAGEPATEASDWYSAGAMLYEALSGRRPFPGRPAEVLAAKRTSQPPPLSPQCDGVPEPLCALCRDLLQREPAARLSGAGVFKALQQIWPRAEPAVRPAPRAPSVSDFVGRQAQLRTLHDAFDGSRLGRAQAVFVHGDSGMGKTALVHRFLEELRARDLGTVILEGRCYERESVPYKALDSLVDHLTRYLRKLSRSDAEIVLPRDVAALTRLFPVLRRVEAIAELYRRPIRLGNAQEQRRRGFAAFRELLARVSDRHSMTLVIDDLQWGDADSADLLNSLLRADEPPPLLFIACYRSQDLSTNPALQSLVSMLDPASALPAVDVHEVPVNQLSDSEAEKLAGSLSRTYGAAASIATIVRESGRSPFFIGELVQYSARKPGPLDLSGERLAAEDAPAGDLTLETVIRGRVGRVRDGARRLLHVLALIGRPVKLAVACEIAELGLAAMDDVIELRSAHLTRARLTGTGEEIELYHDRIREAILAQIPERSRRLLHARIATVLEQAPDPDPDALVLHFHAAGDSHQASLYALVAADRARDALAFDRAARRYRLALEYGEFDAVKRKEIHLRLGDALAARGRGHAAAQAYLAAASGALAADQLELKRRAAEQLLRSGHFDEGMRVLNQVLAALGMRLPTTPGQALLSLLMRRLWIRLRGMRFRERDRSELSAAEIVRVDTCWSVATVIGVVDTIRGADFQARHLLLALASGESMRVCRAFAVEIAYTSLGGAGARKRQQQLIGRAEALVARLAQPEPRALLNLAKGTAAFFAGDWAEAHQLFESGEPLLRECSGVTWELDTAHLYHVLALVYLGEIKEVSARLPAILQEARERDDLTAETNLRTRTTYIVKLAEDNPDQASLEVQQGMAGWAHPGFHAQHSWELYARTEIDLYRGDGAMAWGRLCEHWKPLRRSMLLRIQAVRVESLYLRARSAIAAWGDEPPEEVRRRLLKTAARDAERLQQEGAMWAAALGALVEAGVDTMRDDPGAAVARLAAAEASFRDLGMRLHATVALRRRGQLLTGREGERLVQEADTWMTAQSIRNPSRMAAMLAPGVFAAE